jgi:hypothetical protein
LIGEPEENRTSADVGSVGKRWQMGGYGLDSSGSGYAQVAVFMRKVMKLWDP